MTPGLLADMKKRARLIRAYHVFDAPEARRAEAAGAHVLIVCDLVGPSRLGYDSVFPVTLSEILHHLKAVKRAAKRALLVAGMPFLSYEIDPKEALKNAGVLVKEGGAQAVKIEGGIEVGGAVKELVRANIPVMGHLGLTPHSRNRLGIAGRRLGTEKREAERLLTEARVIEGAGAFAMVLERVAPAAAAEISKSLSIAVLGNDSGARADGVVTVLEK